MMSTRNGCRILSDIKGHEVTARPREVKWSSGDATVFAYEVLRSSNQSNRVDYTDLIICGHK